MRSRHWYLREMLKSVGVVMIDHLHIQMNFNPCGFGDESTMKSGDVFDPEHMCDDWILSHV